MSSLTLTPEQARIIHAPAGHYLITAVAGSGKTTTLAYRIAHLLQQNTDPRRILVLMFNKAAQREFRDKLQQVLPPSSLCPEVRTFHAMGYRFYQRLVADGHLPAFSPRILQESEMQYQFWRLAQRYLDGQQLKLFRRSKKEHLELCLRFCEGVKSQLLPAETFFEFEGYEPEQKWLLSLFHAFEDWRRQQNRISYADMLATPIQLLQQQPQLVTLLRNKMDVILVDEYQDTNRIQHEWLKLIAGQRAQVMAVGDPDQTIYEYRGARPEYMIGDFLVDFPDTERLTLSTSFRYGHQVALLANHLIQHNHARQEMLCRAAPTNPHTRIIKRTCAQESHEIASMLADLPASERERTVILLRVWSQATAIELQLLKHDIPYRIHARRSVFQHSDFQAIQYLLALASGNISDSDIPTRHQCLLHCLKFPHAGLNEHLLHAIAEQAARLPGALSGALRQVVPGGLKKFQEKKLLQRADALQALEAGQQLANPLLNNYVKDTELFSSLRSLGLSHEQAAEREASLRALLDYVCHVGGSAQEVLHHIDTLRCRAAAPGGKGVLLTSMHQSKGLEWPRVIVPGLCQNLIPYQSRAEPPTPAHLESERRLLYVAMTRALEELQVFCPQTDHRAPSCFEHELQWSVSEQLGTAIEQQATQLTLKARPSNRQIARDYATLHDCRLTWRSEPESEVPIWHARRVAHKVFGEGRVLENRDDSFTVAFNEARPRTFSKRVAEDYFSVLEAN